MPNVDPYVEKVMEVVGDAYDQRMPIDFGGWRTRVRQEFVDATDAAAQERAEIVECLLASDNNVEVACCGLCPLIESFDDRRGVGATCMHPDLKEPQIDEVTMFKQAPPDFCPLRSQATRILLAEGV